MGRKNPMIVKARCPQCDKEISRRMGNLGGRAVKRWLDVAIDKHLTKVHRK